MQQAKVSDTSEAFGQDMEQQAPEELRSWKALDHLNDSSGHNHVYMGVIVKLSIVGMQHGMCADPSLPLWIATGKTIDCLPGSLDQSIIQRFLMLPECIPLLC